MFRKAWILSAVLFFALPGSEVCAEPITLYTYHNHPPFVTGKSEGLTYELASILNEHAKGRYNFAVQVVPRSRLNVELEQWYEGECLSHDSDCRDDWIVMWVNPSWGFSKEPMKIFSWKKILQDSNSIISRTERKVEYESPESIIGLRFGGIRGHRYVGLDDLAEQGKLQRIYGNKERDNVIMLLKDRLDVILLPTSTINYYLLRDEYISKYSSEIYVAPGKHQDYSRNFMIPKTRPDIVEFIDNVKLSDGKWLELLEDYGISGTE